MQRDKAREVSRVMKRIEKCEDFLESLKGKYKDEFTIYYNGLETCELEVDMLEMIIKHYECELITLNDRLDKL